MGIYLSKINEHRCSLLLLEIGESSKQVGKQNYTNAAQRSSDNLYSWHN